MRHLEIAKSLMSATHFSYPPSGMATFLTPAYNNLMQTLWCQPLHEEPRRHGIQRAACAANNKHMGIAGYASIAN